MAGSSDNVRLEAFCDGVFAIAITLLIIEVRIPHAAEINDTPGLWHALKHVAPSILAYLLSFCVILITWVNHHNHMKLVRASSAAFLYANGFLLLTVAFVPFPTSLLGEYLFTDHVAPAVILYNAALALQAVGWVLISRTVIAGGLARNEQARTQVGQNGRFGLFAIALYGLFAVLAIWIPHSIAALTALTWVFWLVQGISMKQGETQADRK
jgi:uncharacterized membrane protein